jgi:trans-2,3-dihydro-3-hydroxyanthranilate isomerase
MNFSETAYIAPGRSGEEGHRVRIFTPAREIAFAGHPILGAAWVARQEFAAGIRGTVRLDLTPGPVRVSFERSVEEGEIAWFLAPPIALGPTCPPERIATALGLSPGEIDRRFPVQRMAAGTAAVIVALRTLDSLRRCRLDLAAYAPLASDGWPPLVYLFCAQTHEPGNDLCARFFFEAHGVREDPATGNGAAFLGAYLLEHRYFASDELCLRIEQGHEVGRPSLVRLRARTGGGSREIHVGGKVIPVVRGELL